MNPFIATRDKLNFDIWQMPTVGNGYIGCRIAYSGEGREIEDELWYSASAMAVGLYGDWSRHGSIRMPCAVQLPNFLHFEPFFKGVAWRNDPWVEWADYRQELNYRNATCTTSYRMVPNGARVTQKVYAHRANRHLVVQEMTVETAEQAVDFSTVILNPLGQFKNYTQGIELLESFLLPGINAQVHRCAITNTSQVFSYGERILVADDPKSAACAGPGVEVHALPRLNGIPVMQHLPPHSRITVYKVTACTDSRLTGADQHVAFLRDQLAGLSFDTMPALQASHDAAWEEIWNAIPAFDGGRVSEAFPAMIYILLISMGAGVKASMQVCGVSNTRPWMGKPFRWDQDVFVFPGLAPLFPQWTADMTEGSYKDPFLRGFGEGSDPKSIGTPAVPLRLLLHATWGSRWSRELMAANWWMVELMMQKLIARAQFNATIGQYEIKQGHPADERGPLEADNNIFWQASAWYLVKAAIEIAEYLGKGVPEKWRHLDTAGFYMPFDEENSRHLEYATWFPPGSSPDLSFITKHGHSAYAPDLTLKPTSTPVAGLLAQFYNGHERKQGDVELAYLPLEILTDRTTLENDFRYYAPRITPWGAPEMQNGWFAAIEAELGTPEKALGWLEQVVDKWVKGDMRVFTEMQSNFRGLFTTGAGDVLAGAVWGILGYRPRPAALRFVPALHKETVRFVECGRLTACGSTWSVRFDLQADGTIAYRIAELTRLEGTSATGELRRYAGQFTGVLEIPL